MVCILFCVTFSFERKLFNNQNICTHLHLSALANLCASFFRKEFLYNGYIVVWEGILLGRAEKFALKITICPETNFFSVIRMGLETSCKSVLYI